MSPAMRVLRFPRSDDKAAFVLVQVTQKGSKPLDLKLVGTEGEEPYVTSLKHDKVVSLRVNNCPASESEWQKIIESLFQQEPLPDIQATATVQSEKSISITLRKEVQGITQRLGAITLSHDPDEAIELFEWCGAAVESSTGSKQAAADLAVRSSEAEVAVTQLQSQLEDLIKAKCEDETMLLRRFRDLLNEKKIKIREQQQALAALAANPSMAGQSQPSQAVEVGLEQPRQKKPSRQAAKSRPAKRKAPARRVEESEDDAGINTMDVDVKQEPDDTDPGNTTEATASVNSDDNEDDAVADASAVAHLKSSQQIYGSTSAAASQEKAPAKAVEKPPPPRALPFATKKTAPTPAGDETESDDEL